MSLLSTAVYANPSLPLWSAVGSGGGATGPTGPTGGSGPTGPTGPSSGGAVASQTLLGQFGSGASEGAVPATGSYFTRALTAGLPILVGGNSTTIAGMSLTSNVITLPAGTYSIKGAVPAFGVGRHKGRLYNQTDSNVQVLGQSAYADTAGQVEVSSLVQGVFTLTAQARFALEQQCENTGNPTLALGVSANFGDPEVYSVLTIDKVA